MAHLQVSRPNLSLLKCLLHSNGHVKFAATHIDQCAANWTELYWPSWQGGSLCTTLGWYSITNPASQWPPPHRLLSTKHLTSSFKWKWHSCNHLLMFGDCLLCAIGIFSLKNVNVSLMLIYIVCQKRTIFINVNVPGLEMYKMSAKTLIRGRCILFF